MFTSEIFTSTADFLTGLPVNVVRFYCFSSLLTLIEGLSVDSSFSGDCALSAGFSYCNFNETNWISLRYLARRALEKFRSVLEMKCKLSSSICISRNSSSLNCCSFFLQGEKSSVSDEFYETLSLLLLYLRTYY